MLFLMPLHICADGQEIMSLNSGNVVWQVRPSAEQDNWINATVPGTFFVDYVNAGIEKNPEFGDNIYKVDRVKYNRRHIYRTTFNIEDRFIKPHRTAWLQFEGINRSGIIRLNGKELGELRGMMMRGTYNVTDILKKDGNELTVTVDVPKQTRHPEEKFANMASPAYLSSAGWDWMPNVPGLNSGITDDVSLKFTGAVLIKDPWIRTDIDDGHGSARTEISMTLCNASDKKVKVAIEGIINPGNVRFRKEMTINAGTEIDAVFSGSDAIHIANPSLWWPNGLGEQNLYKCQITVSVDGRISDTLSETFGIREFDYKTDENGVFNIYVNGKRTFLKGGNWGMSEYLLRCRGNEYDTKVRLHKEMNFNIIRNWMGSVTDEEFYDACDRYGILVWDDFWLNSKIGLPEFPEDFNRNAVEKIIRLRNHPSIVVWCGENEGTPGTYPSGESLDKNLAEFVKKYDGGDRHYQSDSREGNGLSGSGRWHNYPPEFYFKTAQNSIAGDEYPENRGWGFRSEIGTAVFTTFESFKKFIPEKYWWPYNDMWNKHFFGPLAKNGGYDTYMKTIETKYGTPDGIEDFCEKAQLVNLETNKAMFEAWGSKMWNDASAIMIWMSQPAYPSFVWQTYDYYYDLTGAFWGAKKGCEPLHILWDSHLDKIMVANYTQKRYEEMTAYAMIYDKTGKQIKQLRKQVAIDIPENSSVTCFDVFDDTSACNLLSDVNFMRLSLKSHDGKTVSSNDYWFGKDRSDCSGLNDLPEADLAFYVSRREVVDGKYNLDFKITNKSPYPAFGVRCTLFDKRTGDRILPVIQSDNYLTLLPGEVRIVTFECKDSPYYDNTCVHVKVKQYGHDEILVE